MDVHPSDESLGYFLSSWRTWLLGLRSPIAGFVLITLFVISPPRVFADETTSPVVAPKFLGSQTCSSSSCHGGAGEKSNQYTIWSTHDFHHARPYATLETARSERLAEVLKLGNPTQSARCTVCHAPFATVPADRLGHDAQISEGISCETCHGPAENWLRSHTRHDYTHADRGAAGMRDLKNLYVRANTCVACHQNIDPEIRAAGHPELIFELDGQSVTMPRHWREERTPADRWFVGQAVALREMSAQLQSFPSLELSNRWAGLLWVLQRAGKPEILQTNDEDIARVQKRFDGFAREIAMIPKEEPSANGLKQTVQQLSASSTAFEDKMIPVPLQARRAERLTLALDRLVIMLPGVTTNSAVNQSLNKLFADAQSLPDFDPNQFAKDLNTFHSSVAGFLETK
ncbi:MAG TPA: multiheme c-type cytochrome [Verrucomicrobiae bacterium]|jgi:hypothetical protein|nr:multiheme c-type cytochrome [Verrucomicrobiae bacterium]